jgi:hypothetical protein
MLTDIKPKLDALHEILSKQIDAHKKLAASAIELRDALVACDNAEIERLCRENERIAAEVRSLEHQRIDSLADTDLDADALKSFTAIDNFLEGVELTEEEADAIEDLRRLRIELAGHINMVDHHNQLNLTLVGQALEFHEFSLRMLLNAAGGEATGYTADGPSHDSRDSGIFEGRA